jgi:hypothetical protein
MQTGSGIAANPRGGWAGGLETQQMNSGVVHALRFKKSALLQRVNCVRHRRKSPDCLFCQGFLAIRKLKKGSALFKQGHALGEIQMRCNSRMKAIRIRNVHPAQYPIPSSPAL